MKTIGKRTYLLTLVVLLFCAGLCLFTFRLFTNFENWTSMPYNAHLTDDEGNVKFGNVYDRNGETIYSSKDSYNYFYKEALLHTTGDLYGNISSGVFSMYKSKLSGYNFITGLNDSFKERTNAYLTVDSGVSLAAYNLLGNRNGAVFIYNYKTGEVICDVSTPTYDPLNIPDDIDTNEMYEGAYIDKNYSAAFTPGSIFKVVTAMCAMENIKNYDELTFNCKGSLSFDDGEVTCLDIHGELTIEEAMMYSCNCVFGELALTLGKDKLTKTANKLGFNASFPFERTKTAKSIFDVTDANEVDLAWAGIGQYSVTATPYHMALLMGTIAGNGVSAKPYVLNSVKSVFDIPMYLKSNSASLLSLNYNEAVQIKKMLRNNVENYYGDYLFPDMNVCAKTGTAETIDGKEDTAWFIGFCDNPSTPYAFAVMVEEGGFGYQTAAPIASYLLQMLY